MSRSSSTTSSARRSADPSAIVADDLVERDREILRDVIHTYVLTGEPVGSRTVSKHGLLGLSAASIRNSMADLEDAGLLRQPHTSAGRVPTEAAYRLYVESLMRMRSLPVAMRRHIEVEIGRAGVDGEQLLATASQLLSELSQQAGMVLEPAVDEIELRSADFLSLSASRVLCVLVSKSGFVDNVVVEVDEPIDRADLVRISNYVTESFAGMNLRRVRDKLLRAMAADRSAVDAWLARALSLAHGVVEGQLEPGVLVEGASSLLDRPELADLSRVRRMLDAFADKARLVEVLSRCLESDDGVRLFLGQDTDWTSELDFSIVATAYGNGETVLGSLGVVGPSRMEYPRIVPLVRYLGATLSRAFATSHAEAS